MPLRRSIRFSEGHGHGNVHAVWYYNPRTLGEVANLASNIVVAKVIAVNEGEDLWVAGNRVPTQTIAFETGKALKGETSGVIELFHTGDDHFVLDGDPPYEAGQTYVLFLTQREDGKYLVVSPEGRYQVGTDDRIIPVSKQEFATKMQNVGLKGLAMDVKEAISK